MIEIVGKGGISAKVIAHSKSAVNGKEIITYELQYHRFIHAEVMTHRMLSRNSASSRAIPVQRMIDLVREFPATPIHWGKNQAGMQAREECDNKINWGFADYWGPPQEAWEVAADSAVHMAERFTEASYHKQIVNRLLEPFQMMKVVVSATEFDNFFHLRNHADAQPEIAELARVMLEAKKQSEPETLYPGEWHTPYVDHLRCPVTGVLLYGYIKTEKDYQEAIEEIENSGVKVFIGGEEITGGAPDWSIFIKKNKPTIYLDQISKEEALKISCSCCAQVSYRKLDDSLEKAIAIYDRLVTSEPVHASALEHCATPMPLPYNEHWHNDGSNGWVDGVTHVDIGGNFWSGNFQSFIQYRQLVPNHVCNNYNYKEE